ncbi:BlaI/MecI/CopY family transcriptional regulator [Microbulbifer sp. ZKSA004]|uniref:BlaI/MecI/CopY family transcriptional regulator n=1 Tax=Microbulbifer sp. ZKSA004 TaxID=3243389 RepID=UPI004039AABB
MEITDAEFEVMEAMWQGAPATARELYQRLHWRKSWQEKTVRSLIGRLVKKGALSFEKADRGYLYSPCIERGEYQLKQGRSILDRLFEGRVSLFFSGFASSGELKRDDIEELKELIRNWEQENE